MVRTDILEGLRAALIRGESLKQAMQSFYNAGYKKEDIEKAARALYGYQQTMQQSTRPQPVTQQPLQSIRQRIPTKPLPTTQYQPQPQQIQRLQPQQQALRAVQRVSDYDFQTKQMQPEESKKYIMLIVFLSIILFILLGVLVSVIIFKEKIIGFFAEVFG